MQRGSGRAGHGTGGSGGDQRRYRTTGGAVGLAPLLSILMKLSSGAHTCVA